MLISSENFEISLLIPFSPSFVAILQHVGPSTEFCQTPLPLLRILTISSYCVLLLVVFVRLEEQYKGKSNCFVWLLKMRTQR